MDMDLRILWSLIRRTDTSELLDLTSSCFLIQSFGIALLSFFYRDVHKNLDEW